MAQDLEQTPKHVLLCTRIARDIFVVYKVCLFFYSGLKIEGCFNVYVKYSNRAEHSVKYDVCCSNIYVKCLNRVL